MPTVRYDARKAAIVNAIDDCDHGFCNRHGALLKVLEAAGYNHGTQQFDPQTLHTFCAEFEIDPETIYLWSKEIEPPLETPMFERRITYEVGDQVDWSSAMKAGEHDPDFGPLPSDEFGPGPFEVFEVAPISVRILTCGHYPEDPEHMFCSLHEYVEGDPEKTARQEAGHHQMLTVKAPDDRMFTGPGSWFEPVQTSEWTLAHDGEGGRSYYFGDDFDIFYDEWGPNVDWLDEDWDHLLEIANQTLPQHEGVNITCRVCGEVYWSEDPHECDFAEPREAPAKGTGGFVTCGCGTSYFHEDQCPVCSMIDD